MTTNPIRGFGFEHPNLETEVLLLSVQTRRRYAAPMSKANTTAASFPTGLLGAGGAVNRPVCD